MRIHHALCIADPAHPLVELGKDPDKKGRKAGAGVFPAETQAMGITIEWCRRHPSDPSGNGSVEGMDFVGEQPWSHPLSHRSTAV